MDLSDHDRNLKIIGKVFFVIGLLLIPLSIFSFFFHDLVSGFDFHWKSDDVRIMFLRIKPVDLLYFFPIFYSFLSILFLVSGLGLANEKEWGRKLVLVPAVILLFKFPVGTALGGYIIYATQSNQLKEVNGA